jgi:lipopolysaccharide/colanic/teichoic acid biosynthesis glycosyltransferase
LKKQSLQYWILAADIAWAAVAMLVACLMRYGFHWYAPPGTSLASYLSPLLVATTLWVVIFLWMQLDGFRRGWHASAVFSQLFVALCFLMAILLAGGYLLHIFLSRLTFIYFGILLLIGFGAIRCFANALLGSKYFAKAVRRVLIVGNGQVAREMAAKIKQHPEMLCKIVGFLHSADTSLDPRIPGDTLQAQSVQTLELIDLLRQKSVDELIITGASPGNPEIMNLAARCRQEGIGVSVVPHPYELYLSKPQLLDIGGLPVLQLRERSTTHGRELGKRFFDVSVGACLAAFAAPIVALGAIGLLSRKGGPFIRELRCGHLGKPFWMYRLNSDRDNPNVNRYERLLQQLSITEMPQLWNVLRADMSLIGPRPESPERVKHYSNWQRQRLKIKPGITGLAQVSGLREQHSSEEKTRFDLQYMMQASLFVDVSLILQTVWTLTARLLHLYRSSDRDADEDTQAGLAIERILLSADSTQSSSD